jgi:bilin biosynthesis protein
MTIDPLFEQLKHPNPYMRERAMTELLEANAPDTISRLMGVLDSEDVVYRRAAVKALGLFGNDAVSPLVDALLHSDNITVRGSAAKALAQVAINYPENVFPDDGLQGLKQAIQDDNPVVHIAAIMALGEIGGAALEILLDALKTTDNIAVQVSIVNALASVGGERASEVLVAAAADEAADPYVRESATSALSRLQMVATYNRSDS